jgi:alpha-tubulin suppressor-like RCC1 family protein
MGELARGNFDANPHPQPLPVNVRLNTPADSIVDFALGGRHGCLIMPTQTSANIVHCWGSDTGCPVTGNVPVGSSQCASTSGQIYTLPTPVANVPKSVMVAAGSATSCAVSDDRRAVTCWGNNKYATIGNPNAPAGDSPPMQVSLPAGTTVQRIEMGNAFACVLIAGNRTLCWGQNNDGQIGGTPPANVAAPVDVPALAGYTHLTAAGFHLCAYQPSDPTKGLICMGSNMNGELGIGSADANPHPTPTEVRGLIDVVSASVGNRHACAIARKQGETSAIPRRVFCWGQNAAGEVKLPPTPAAGNETLPVEVKLP